jgi:hypothetical protein
VQAHDLGEEDPDHELCRVWVCKRDEVAVFAEAIHHRQDDILSSHTRKRLDEVQPDVSLDRYWQRKGQQQASWM